MNFIVVFCLAMAAIAAGAAQFRISTQHMSVARSSVCGVSWKNTTLFLGGAFTADSDILDVFRNGRFEKTVVMPDTVGTCASAVAFPGILAISSSRVLQFFDVRNDSMISRSTSILLNNPARDRGAVGSRTTGIVAFNTAQGDVEFVDVNTQNVTSTLSIGRAMSSAVRVQDTNGQEYFVFFAGTGVADSLPKREISVIAVQQPFTLTATSQMVHARTAPICTTTTSNTMVCAGGNDANTNYVHEVETCTISTTGQVTCTSHSFSEDYERFPVGVGPFVLSMPRLRRSSPSITAADPTDMVERILAQLPWGGAWFRFGFASAGRFAYVAGGRVVTTEISNVTVVECLEPCTPPLFPPTSTPTTGDASSTDSSGKKNEPPICEPFAFGLLLLGLILV